MLNRIIRFSLYNRLTVLIISALLLVVGTIVLLRTEIDIFPDLNAPTVVVMTEAPGLAPEEVEQLVTFPIETGVNGATGVRRVRSSSATGFSAVSVEFDWGMDVYRARQIVSEKLQEIADQLPPGAKAPVLGPQSSILGEILFVGLTADGSTSQSELRTLADRTIRPRILALGGVSQVTVIGGDIKEYQVQLNPGLMTHYGVTLDDVMSSLERVNDNAGGGILYEYGNEYIIKADVNTADTAAIAASLVKVLDNGASITVADIGKIAAAHQEPRLGLASERTRPAVILTVNKQPATGTIELTERIEEELADIARTLPSDVHVSTDIFRQSTFIDNSIGNLQQSLFEGIIFVIVVLFFFLMNLRTTVISVVALPMSIIIAVLVLHLLGFTINTMSLGGIAIAIGSLVDDAIVDVENVYRRLRQNRELPEAERKPALRVVYDASKEVRMPIFNSSLIIIASFLPLFFLSGIEGRMLIPLGVSFIVALIASTIVALTLTPVLCSMLLGGTKRQQATLDREPWLTRRLATFYRRALEWTMCHRPAVIGSVAALFLVTIALFFTLGRSFLPPFNEGSFTINVSTLPGVALEESDRVGRLAEEIIMSTPEVLTVARKTGRAELDEHSLGANVSEIEAPYVLDKGRTRSQVVRELRSRLGELPGVNIEIGQPISHRIDAMLSGTEAQIAIKLFGPDLATLYATGTRIKDAISDVKGVVDVNIEQQIGRPQIDIRPRRDLLAARGISVAEFTRLVDVALAGEVVSQVYEDGIPRDVTVKMEESSRNSIEKLRNLPIDSKDGKIALSEVADIVSTTGPNTINRENVNRRLVISANVDDRDLRSTVNDIARAINSEVEIPEGYYVTYGGQFESEAAASRTLALTSLLALLVIFMLLYQEFHDLRESLVILINMPLAMIGGVLILVLTGAELNIPAIIGFISLLGIATRNGMLLMSRYNALEAEGVPLADRIFRGSADRLNPILMTALTSALALIPIALRGGEAGNEIQSPLAVVILGGLISSTLLNVFVVPILYYYISIKRSNKQ
ncbi:MAG: CusA/CzcA family heavy metal efflux RND transporter [Muribaculaceae bacterium]|nr:CusA/CzcA family heavy metal efflux RND transporter [Muribaculaceae bacterium]